jgi:hypothetical protein
VDEYASSTAPDFNSAFNSLSQACGTNKANRDEDVDVYVRGTARECYTIPWDKKKAQELLTSEKIFGEDSLNITNLNEVQYTVKFPNSNPPRTAFSQEDFLNLTYQALSDKSKTTPSPQLEALKRRQNPYS